jgi:hypothetical protein
MEFATDLVDLQDFQWTQIDKNLDPNVIWDVDPISWFLESDNFGIFSDLF